MFLAALGQGLINMGYALAFLTTTVTEALMLISLHLVRFGVPFGLGDPDRRGRRLHSPRL